MSGKAIAHSTAQIIALQFRKIGFFPQLRIPIGDNTTIIETYGHTTFYLWGTLLHLKYQQWHFAADPNVDWQKAMENAKTLIAQLESDAQSPTPDTEQLTLF